MVEVLNPWVCYRRGKNRRKCDTCEAERPKAYKRCFYYDPRKIPPREEQVCECGKTYRNWMCFIRHQIHCETVFIQRVSKLIVNEDGSPVAINTKALISQEQTKKENEPSRYAYHDGKRNHIQGA